MMETPNAKNRAKKIGPKKWAGTGASLADNLDLRTPQIPNQYGSFDNHKGEELPQKKKHDG